jgi:hypothetical protein
MFETGDKLEETMDTTALTENTATPATEVNAAPFNIQYFIDTLPDGWTFKTFKTPKDEDGIVQETFFYNENREPIAKMAADENGVIIDSHCKEFTPTDIVGPESK